MTVTGAGIGGGRGGEAVVPVSAIPGTDHCLSTHYCLNDALFTWKRLVCTVVRYHQHHLEQQKLSGRSYEHTIVRVRVCMKEDGVVIVVVWWWR